MPWLVFAEKAYLQITRKVDPQDRPAAGAGYTKFKRPFLGKVPGAKPKELLVRDDDVQVLHGFATRKQAEAYLRSEIFQKDVVVGLKPLLKADPELREFFTPFATYGKSSVRDGVRTDLPTEKSRSAGPRPHLPLWQTRPLR